MAGEMHASAPATVFTEHHGDGDWIEPHRHDFAQVVGMTHGLIRVSMPAAIVIVPPMHAVWIPAGVEHDIRFSGTANLLATCIAYEPHVLDTTIRVFAMTPLLTELLRAAAGFSADYRDGGPETRLIAVMLDQIEQGRRWIDPRALTLPVSPALRVVAEGLLRQPGSKRTLDSWSLTAGASVRTLERRFKEETGLAFSNWRRQLQMSEALGRLSCGESVTSVAIAVGYATPSAFIKAFRATYDVSPAQLLSHQRAGEAGTSLPQFGGSVL